MRKLRVIPAVILSMLFLALQVGPAFAADGLSVTPGTISINEGASASSLLTGITPTQTEYFGKYVQVSVDSADATDSLTIATVSTPVITEDAVSVVGSLVYVGDGLFARRIGQIDSTLAGGPATALKINLDTFDTIPSANWKSAWAGWTNSNPVNATSASSFGESFIPSGGITFEQLGRWSGIGGGPSSLFANSTFTTLANSSVIGTSPGIYNDSLAIHLNMSATGLPIGGGSIRGAGVTSPEFNATAGDRVSFTHRNLDTSFSVTTSVAMWVGLVDVSTQKFVSVGHAVMHPAQGWADYSIFVPTTGRFKLAISAGALWPSATGSLLRTAVKLDMFDLKPPLSSTVVANLFKAVKYQSSAVNPSSSKTIRYQIGTGSTPSATATQTVNFTLNDDPAVPVDSSLQLDNTEGVQDTFANVTGNFGGTDGDSSLLYSAQNATTVSSTFSGITYDRKIIASLGTLYFKSTTGQWTLVPNASVINSQNFASNTFVPLELNGVPFNFTIATRMVAAPPPSITVETSTGEVVSPPPVVEEPPAIVPPVVPAAAPVADAAKSDKTPKSPPSLSDALLNALSDPAAAVAALLNAAFAPPSIITDPSAAVANPAIGASGDDSAPVEAFDPLGSPESIAALSGALVMGVALAGGVAAATAGGSAGSAGEAPSGGESGSSDGGAELEGLEASEDVITISRSAWGDKLPIFGSALFVFLDRFSHDSAIRAARFSPMFAKLIIDGAYLRAMTGSMSLLLPVATSALAVMSAVSNHGQLLPPQWGMFLAIALIGVFDAFAGFIGAAVFIAISLLTAQEQIQASDLRMYFGVLFISMGPALLMTAFRALRKDTVPGFVGVWDRATDFVIAPVMAGVSVTTAVTVLPALAGLTLPVANHVAAFGIYVAAAAMVRVIFEEFATKAFPARLNAINPSSLPEPPAIQQWAAIVMSYGIWVFLTGALSGEVWQVYVGSFFFLLPTILGKFSDSFPNSVFLWRVMPQGMPGLVFTLFVSAASAMIVMAFIGANPAFAAWNMVLLPLPILVIALLGLLGRHGATPDEVRFSQRNPLIFRLGGVLILIVALRLMGIA